MLVNIDAQDISALSQQFGKLVASLLDVVRMPALPLEIEATIAGNFRGFDGSQFYVVQRGSITARYQGKTIYTLEAGDILLPDITGGLDHKIAVYYGSEAGAQ
jgi:CRP/FNR family transcriptional regulator, cyclic AMP receptor protein